MGKKGSSTSWLTAVKRAFRSPTKESSDQKRNTRRKEDHNNHLENNEDDEKKREKRRWLFRKPTIHETTTVPRQQQQIQQKDDVSAMEVLPNKLNQASNLAKEISAAIVIQTGFRGYLARRALRALKGLVKLQALVRGHNVRKQAKMTLKCMQALVRVQSRVLDQRMRLSHDGNSRKSAFSDTTSLCGSRYLQDIGDRKSVVTSRDGSSVANDDWDDRPHTIEEVKAMLQSRKDAAALRRERNLSQAFSQQIWRSGRNSSIGGEDEIEEEKPKWLDRWMATKPWEKTRGRTSADQRDSVKTVEIDTAQPYSYLSSSSSLRRPMNHHQNQRPNSPHQNQRPNSPLKNQRPSSPHHRSNQSSVTPSPSKTRPIQIRSASPRCGREDIPQTPSLRSYNYQYNSGLLNPNIRFASSTSTNSGGALPNYMAATESAKARVRSQSAPRQRMATPERERNGSVKKRLSYPVLPDGSVNHHQQMRSPSFKSVHSRAYTGFTEQQSNYSSCYTESIGGEISPSSTTTDLRRWMR